MLMVSSSRDGAEIGGGAELAGLHQRLEHRRGDVLDVGLAAIDGVDFGLLSTSMPVTQNPACANSTASGRPTYPSPTTPTCALVRLDLLPQLFEMIRHLI